MYSATLLELFAVRIWGTILFGGVCQTNRGTDFVGGLNKAPQVGIYCMYGWNKWSMVG